MARRTYRFMLKNSKEISFIGTRYYPVEVDPNLSPYTTVLATIWDEEHMVGQVNQTEILAWWSEVYQEPQQPGNRECDRVASEDTHPMQPEKPAGVLLPSEN